MDILPTLGLLYKLTNPFDSKMFKNYNYHKNYILLPDCTNIFLFINS